MLMAFPALTGMPSWPGSMKSAEPISCQPAGEALKAMMAVQSFWRSSRAAPLSELAYQAVVTCSTGPGGVAGAGPADGPQSR